RVADVVERARVQQDQIGELALFDRAELTRSLQESRRLDRRSPQRLERREPRGDEALELAMQADTGDDVDARRRVRPGEERYPRAVQPCDDAELVLDELLAHRKGIRVEVLDDPRRELGPALLA